MAQVLGKRGQRYLGLGDEGSGDEGSRPRSRVRGQGSTPDPVPELVPLLMSQMESSPLAAFRATLELGQESALRLSSPAFASVVRDVAMASLRAGSSGDVLGVPAGTAGTAGTAGDLVRGAASTFGSMATGALPGRPVADGSGGGGGGGGSGTGVTIGIPATQRNQQGSAVSTSLLMRTLKNMYGRGKGPRQVFPETPVSAEVWSADHESAMMVAAGTKLLVTSERLPVALPPCSSGSKCASRLVSGAGGAEGPLLAAMLSPTELAVFCDRGILPPSIKYQLCILCHREFVMDIVLNASVSGIFPSTDRARYRRQGMEGGGGGGGGGGSPPPLPIEGHNNATGPGEYREDVCWLPSATSAMLRGPVVMFNVGYLEWKFTKCSLPGAGDAPVWCIDQSPLLDRSASVVMGAGPPGSQYVPGRVPGAVPPSAAHVFDSTPAGAVWTVPSETQAYASVPESVAHMQRYVTLVPGPEAQAQAQDREEPEAEFEEEPEFEVEPELGPGSEGGPLPLFPGFQGERRSGVLSGGGDRVHWVHQHPEVDRCEFAHRECGAHLGVSEEGESGLVGFPEPAKVTPSDF